MRACCPAQCVKMTADRPHFVVDGSDNYLGMQFLDLTDVSLGKQLVSKVELLYDEIDYSELKPDTRFVIKEGTISVGEGIVLDSHANKYNIRK